MTERHHRGQNPFVLTRFIGGAILLLLIGSIAGLDYSLGPSIQLSIVYLIPIIMAALFLGTVPALLMALAASLAWFWNGEIVVPHDYGVEVTVWNGVSRTTIYLALALAVSRLRHEQLELQRVNRVREDFLSMVAHQLRQPAVALVLLSTGLQGSRALANDEHGILDGLREQARGLARLADQLLAIGQIEAGEFKLNRISCDLEEVVRAAARETAAPSRVEVSAEGGPLLIHADPVRVGQAVDNLLSNALKYSPEARLVTARVAPAGRDAVVEVTDNGIGFTGDEAKLLFRKYGRLDSARAANVEGTGIGLYFTSLLVTAHGGSVSAESRGPGQGATFRLRLPLEASR